MTDWKALELKPINLADIPSELEWCVYPEERERGEVLLPATVYQIVLALRWILTYTSFGYEGDFETWKVCWKCEDKYGFRTQIFLFREKVEQYDYDGELEVLQEQTWVQLASLHCSNGEGVINRVYLPNVQPYGSTLEVSGASGVQRLLEDAILASQATNNYIDRNHDRTLAYRTSSCQAWSASYLSIKLEHEDGYKVKAIDLKSWHDPMY